MNGYEQVLVVVLSSFLALFLLLGIIVLVLVIKVLKTVKKVTDHAEQLATKAEAVGDFFQHAAGPMAIGRGLATVAEMFFKRQNQRKKKG